jgi:hypothetical protein
MSTSADSATTKPITASTVDNEKGKEDKQGIIDNKNQSINTKESKFSELIGLLQKWGYKVVDRSKENIIEGVQFQAEVSPLLPYSSGASTPFFLEFQNDLDDAFIIRSTFELDKNIELHLKNQRRAREIELAYLEIEQIILPMKISVIRKHPIINIYKIIFSEGLTKQFFFNCINDLVNAMALIIGKWDQKYYEIKPKTAEGEPNKK